MKRKTTGKVRIIGGLWRGRKISVPDVTVLRPTPDRVRETLFNWLQADIEGSRCLDLFAGTGVLGLEAKSRGATRVVFIEQNPVLIEQLQKNIGLLDANGLYLEKADALQWLQATDQKFDTVFLDPPYGMGLLERSCELLLKHDCLYPRGWVYIEGGKGLQVPAGFEVVKQGAAGLVRFMLLQSN